jgi:hypothetical protein
MRLRKCTSAVIDATRCAAAIRRGVAFRTWRYEVSRRIDALWFVTLQGATYSASEGRYYAASMPDLIPIPSQFKSR